MWAAPSKAYETDDCGHMFVSACVYRQAADAQRTGQLRKVGVERRRAGAFDGGRRRHICGDVARSLRVRR